MPRVKKLDLGMTALDELFMNDKERAENKLPKIFDIPLSEIDDFPDHPYRVLDDEDMQNLTEKRKALTIKEQEIFLSYMKQNPKYRHWFPVFYIMLNTGMRVGELTGLRWADVDLEGGMIKIGHTLVYYKKADGKCSYTINTTKTEAGEREIPMTDEVKSAFLAVKEFYDDIGIKCNASVDGYTDFIFLNRDGNLHNQSSLNSAIHRIRRDCNDEILLNRKTDKEPVLLPYFTCHHLRHTFATRLCESGINIKVIQNVLGHVDISTTMNIYIDVTKDLKKEEMQNFANYVRSGNSKEPIINSI